MAKIILLEDTRYAHRIKDIIDEDGMHTLETVNSMKDLHRAIAACRPQLVLIPGNLAGSGISKKIRLDYSFIPIAVYGEFGKHSRESMKKIQKLLKEDYSICFPVDVLLNKESFLSGLGQVLWRGFAKPEIWDRESNISLADSKLTFYRNILAFCMAVSVFVLLGFALKGELRNLKNIEYRTYAVPYSNISGVALSKDFLWTADWLTQNIYKHSLKDGFKITHVFPFPEMRFSGITIADGYLWTLDSWQKKIRKHIFNDRLMIVREYDAPGTNPTGIAYDGRYLLTCDNALNKIFIHRLDDKLSVLKEYSLPGSNPIGIYSDGKYLWVADSENNKIYCCSVNDYELVVDSVFIPSGHENFNLSGISGDDGNILLLSEKESKIYTYPKKNLEVVKSR